MTWEETWSSTQAGSRDSNGELLLEQLGNILRESKTTFADPYFPADYTSLFVDPSQVSKNKSAAASFRSDEQPFLAGKDVVNDIVWKSANEIGNPREKPVVCAYYHSFQM